MSKYVPTAYIDKSGNFVSAEEQHNGATWGEYATNTVVSSGRELLSGLLDSTKNWLPKAISSAQAALAQLSYSGSTGNFLSTDENICLTGKFYRIADTYPEKIGCPLYSFAILTTLNGFVQCKNAVFASMSATAVEETAIEQFMNSGFYFE